MGQKQTTLTQRCGVNVVPVSSDRRDSPNNNVKYGNTRIFLLEPRYFDLMVKNVFLISINHHCYVNTWMMTTKKCVKILHECTTGARLASAN